MINLQAALQSNIPLNSCANSQNKVNPRVVLATHKYWWCSGEKSKALNGLTDSHTMKTYFLFYTMSLIPAKSPSPRQGPLREYVQPTRTERCLRKVQRFMNKINIDIIEEKRIEDNENKQYRR